MGRNGGGDRYFTDGEVTIGVLAPERAPGSIPEQLENPVAVRAKDRLWSAIRPVMRALPEP
jgi:hypothetical protein